MPKKILIAMPPEMLAKVDMIVIAEHRTRSDLIRESLRRYIQGFVPPKELKIDTPVIYKKQEE